MLEHDGRVRLVQTPMTTGLQLSFGAAATDTDSLATTDNNLLYNTIGTQPMKADGAQCEALKAQAKISSISK
ncbi:uncharacterized protein IUM83_14919 [Phytophthora cinnamomi]|uniref:uncharacterized protein n=1 Tax=Phytophthora cinnamomi TaxID=4785 RepID=UPI0035597D3A|nr:hypothetical protein IUM83_14919 [Phytophthora cinnamomi]